MALTFMLYLNILSHLSHLRPAVIVLILTSSPEKIIISTQMRAVSIVAMEWLLTEAPSNRATLVPASDVRNILRVKNKKHQRSACKPKGKLLKLHHYNLSFNIVEN